MGPPTLAGFLAWVRGALGVPMTALPDNSQALTDAFTTAQSIVNPVIAQLAPTIYPLAVYNLAADALVRFAQDQPGQTYFTALRQSLNLSGFVAGVISGSSDAGTSQSILNPEFTKALSMSDLLYLQTPWGRQYLAFAQRAGSDWGLT